MKDLQPDYKQIYFDIITKNNSPNKDKCLLILEKESLTFFDILNVNTLIFGMENKRTLALNQKLRSYDKFTILEILEYQKRCCLNNSELANHFRLSRNTITKWKKQFLKN
ncbi:transposase [Chryseobacterium sp. HMWF028]|nr:transposase [Chryseobacterium sp. HMWF028]